MIVYSTVITPPPHIKSSYQSNMIYYALQNRPNDEGCVFRLYIISNTNTQNPSKMLR